MIDDLLICAAVMIACVNWNSFPNRLSECVFWGGERDWRNDYLAFDLNRYHGLVVLYFGLNSCFFGVDFYFSCLLFGFSLFDFSVFSFNVLTLLLFL